MLRHDASLPPFSPAGLNLPRRWGLAASGICVLTMRPVRKPTTTADVAIVGAGPAGLMLSAELALAGVSVLIIERRPDQVLPDARAGGVHARTIELFDQRGIADRFLREGRRVQAATFGTASLDMSDFPSRYPFSLHLWQKDIERLMAEWTTELGLAVQYDQEVVDFAADESGVDIRLADGGSWRSCYLVGCDGGRSIVRKKAGIDFPGWEATRSNLIAEAQLVDDPPIGPHHDARGVHGMHRIEDGKTFRVVVTEQRVASAPEPNLRDLSDALVSVFGTDFGVHSPTWISRFTDATRQAAVYRSGRVLLAGDAAHIHYPAGGQGLSLAIQDSMNLGWKLAQVVKGVSSEHLLDTYQSERHPVAARALRYTMAQGALQRRDDRTEQVVEIVSRLAALDQPRKWLAGLISGLDICYDLGVGHPQLGQRMPDLDLSTSDGPRRMYTLLHRARPVLLNLGEPRSLAIAGWDDRLELFEASFTGRWELPVVGEVELPSAVLIRPDGYVAWVGQGDDDGLPEALATWFGPPSPQHQAFGHTARR